MLARKMSRQPPLTGALGRLPKNWQHIPLSLSLSPFFLSLTSPSTCKPYQLFQALLDSGSSHSFVHEAFVIMNKFKFLYLPKAIPLRMFNGSTTLAVEKQVCMPIIFPTGEKHNMECFMTNLDQEHSIVLGYDWFTHHNLFIDCTETK